MKKHNNSCLQVLQKALKMDDCQKKIAQTSPQEIPQPLSHLGTPHLPLLRVPSHRIPHCLLVRRLSIFRTVPNESYAKPRLQMGVIGINPFSQATM